MIALEPIPHALVAADSEAARHVSAPNYDEFQSDREVWSELQERPHSVLHITMPHCSVAHPDSVGAEGTEESFEHARRSLGGLRSGPLTRELRDLLFVYEIRGARGARSRQVGLGGMARTDQIRTDRNPDAPIIRNEGVREAKARGRARLIEATRAVVGIVNNAVPDEDGTVATTLETYADTHGPDLDLTDEAGHLHRMWWVREPAELAGFRSLLAGQPEAYVADGNHRSAAAAMLGYDHFLAVFFPAGRMSIAPYNRLVDAVELDPSELRSRLEAPFLVEATDGGEPLQPRQTGEIGWYARGEGWWLLRPRPGLREKGDAVGAIDHELVQRHLFGPVLGIEDPGDSRLTFVGAHRDASWLQSRVDEGQASYAVTLAPVTMEQFVDVCRQGAMMPPKSTWFEPKVRSGLVMALLP